jgi:2-iminobutanoate/2-iminopropanoate deaminase
VSEPGGTSGRRRSIEVEGLSHSAPIPMGARVGPLLVSSGISGQDPATGQVPGDVAEQVRLVYANLRRVLAAGGADAGDVVKLTFFVRDRAVRAAIDEEWLAMFPDEASRPARHTLVAELPPAFEVQCEVIAHVAGDAP